MMARGIDSCEPPILPDLGTFLIRTPPHSALEDVAHVLLGVPFLRNELSNWLEMNESRQQLIAPY